MNNLPPLEFDGEAVDKGILEMVHYMRDGGFNTIASCQGKSPSQPNHPFGMPVVRIGMERYPYPTLETISALVLRVREYTDKKYKDLCVETHIVWGETQMVSCILDVKFIKSVREEFDIAKWRK